MQSILGGKTENYQLVIESYQQSISQQMWKFSRDRQQHEELVQEVFVQAYLNLKSYRGDAPFEHWLRVIAVRVGYRYWKQKAKQQRTVTLESVQHQAQLKLDTKTSDQIESAELVHRLLEQLPPRDRLVLTLFYLQENSIEQTSQLIGWSQSMTKVQLYRARKKMNVLLEKVIPVKGTGKD